MVETYFGRVNVGNVMKKVIKHSKITKFAKITKSINSGGKIREKWSNLGEIAAEFFFYPNT